MFKHLTRFEYKRTRKEAFGFYLAYFLLSILVATVLGGIGGLLLPTSDSFNVGLRIGAIVAIVMSSGLSFIVLKAKNLLSDLGFIMLIFATGLISLFIGGIVGFIVPAYLTTKHKKEIAD